MPKSSTCKIYTLSSPDDDIVRYVGKTVKTLRDRLTGHVSEKRINHRTCWIKSVVNKGVEPKIELIEEVSNDKWQESEIYWIAQFKAWGFDLVNNAIGGVGANGYRHTENAKFKIQQKAIKRKVSDKTRAKMSVSRKKYEQENKVEYRKRYEIRKNNISEKTSEEMAVWRERRSEGVRKFHESMTGEDKLIRADKISVGNGTQCALIDKDGNVIKEYNSLSIAASEFKGIISRESIKKACLSGKSINGLMFKFI